MEIEIELPSKGENAAKPAPSWDSSIVIAVQMMLIEVWRWRRTRRLLPPRHGLG
jgi:hypothetical protein